MKVDQVAWLLFCAPVCDEYVNLAKMFLISKFGYVSFPNPIHKTKIGIANRWGDDYTNCEPLGPVISIGQSETGNSSQIIFITLFLS
jgi:hypothetical protein